jgi:glycosyltransferase involved in cell wall biosynthesis
MVVDAFARAALPSHGISLVLVGQGPLEDELRRRIAQLGLDAQVHILHAVPNRNMPALYTLAEFVVLASEFDQWGLCISEALAAGRPVVVTRTCGVAGELVRDNVNGYIVEPGDAAALATRMSLLGRHHALRERFARNAHAQVRSWTPELFAANLASLADLLARPAVRP